MKLLFKALILTAALLAAFGCSTMTDERYETRLQPPESFNPIFLRYKEQPENKVIVVAVDPGGHWAFGYDHSRDTLQEAAENAALKCDKARKKHKVYSKAKLFAVNNEVVYYDKQFQ
jgi:hypothetical protein